MSRLARITFALAVGAGLAPAVSDVSTAGGAASGHAARAHHRVLVHRRVGASVGAYVRARNGVSVFVPPGVMTRSGDVGITSRGRGVYDIHLSAPWHGTVAVSLPLRRQSDTIVHKVGGIWLTEGTERGQRTVWVHQLSWFTDLAGKVGNKITGSLCLVFSAPAFIKCVVEKGIKHISSKLASWIEARLPGGCNAHLVESGLLRGGPAGVFIARLSDEACIGQAGETPAPQPSPAPTPQPSPAPEPQPTPGPTLSPETGSQPTPQPQPQPTPAPQPAQTWSEQETPNHPVNTFTNYHNASGQGPAVAAGQWIQVSCKVYDPTIQSVNPDGYWYRIASSPWDNAYYSPANTFMNGDPYGGPYTHNTDFAVPNC